MRAVYYFLIVSGLSVSVPAYPNGAPLEACMSMHPTHGHLPQSGAGGYRVFAEPDFTGTRAKWTVTLNGTSPFLGFLLEARSADGRKIVGRWSHLPPRTRALDCGGANRNAVTHHNSDRKKMRHLSFTWTASSCKEAPVYFRATVVRWFTEMYEEIKSDVLNDVCLREPKCKECSNLTKAGRKKLLRLARSRCRAAIRANRPSRLGQGRLCRQHWDGQACWPGTPAGTVARVPCNIYRPGGTGKGFAVRRCNPSGRWSHNGRFKRRQCTNIAT